MRETDKSVRGIVSERAAESLNVFCANHSEYGEPMIKSKALTIILESLAKTTPIIDELLKKGALTMKYPVPMEA